MARILALEGDEHQHVQLLLPWYVNGTLDAGERVAVQAHLGRCARCQADATWQRRLRAHADEGFASIQATPGDHVEHGEHVEQDWARLRERLDPPRTNALPGAAGARSRRRWAGSWSRWWAIAVAAQAVVIAAMAFALWTSPHHPADAYAALGRPLPPAAANALVVFHPDATEAQIRRALRACDARIVGGPTATDAYLLAVPALGPRTLALLRSEPAVLRIESLDGEAAR